VVLVVVMLVVLVLVLVLMILVAVLVLVLVLPLPTWCGGGSWRVRRRGGRGVESAVVTDERRLAAKHAPVPCGRGEYVEEKKAEAINHAQEKLAVMCHDVS
jgi:hypothetical protein